MNLFVISCCIGSLFTFSHSMRLLHRLHMKFQRFNHTLCYNNSVDLDLETLEKQAFLF